MEEKKSNCPENCSERSDPANNRFSCTDSERAAFEAGIKLGGIFHQYIGVPLSLDNVSSLENAIREACLVQPFVEDLAVHIKRDGLLKKKGLYDYTTLTGDMLCVTLRILCNGVRVTACMAYDVDMGYPLMWISEILDAESVAGEGQAPPNNTQGSENV